MKKPTTGDNHTQQPKRPALSQRPQEPKRPASPQRPQEPRRPALSQRTQQPKPPALSQRPQEPKRPASPQRPQEPRRPASPQRPQEPKRPTASLSRETSAEPIESLIPKNIRVIGMTPRNKDSERMVVVKHRSFSGCIHDYYFNVNDLTTGDRKPLAWALAEMGYIDLGSDRATLKRTAVAMYKEAETKNLTVLHSQGCNTVECNGEKFIVYVYNNKAYFFGNKPPVKIMVTNNDDSKKLSGTLDEWIEYIGSKLSGNPYMIVTHAHALAAALRKIFNKPYTSMCLVGPSGVGKSTIQQSAQSQIGQVDEVRSLNGTAIGILEHLQARPDQPVFFQDVRQSDNADIFMKIVFNSADGAGRIKSGSKGKTISSTMLLSNERHVADMKMGKNISFDEGVYSRLCEVSCDGPHGAFHNLHGHDSAAQFADELQSNSNKYYGTVWPEWINKISNEWPRVHSSYEKLFQKIKMSIAKRAGTAAYDRVNNRILDALAFSAWVGMLASKLKILPISCQEIIDAFGLVMKEYIERLISGSTPLADKIISAVGGCLDQNLARFHNLNSFNDKNPTSNVYGYRKMTEHGELFLFLPSVFKELFHDEFGDVIYNILRDTGFLVTTKNRGNQYLARIPGTKVRKSFIAIKANIRFD